MRAFKIWNKNRTSSFDLSGLNVITSDIAGLGNRFTNELYDGIIKKHLINQYNSFEQINLTVNFGVNSNAYQKYREFMNFIQVNGRNILVIEYYTTGTSRFVDVVLSNASKSQKTGFGVLVETVTFDRLTPYYIMYRRTGTSILVSNNYMENVMPKITMSGRMYLAGTKIRVKSKNEAMPDLTDKEYLGNGEYQLSAHPTTNNLIYNVYNGEYRSDIVSVSGGIVMQNFIYNLSGSYTLSVYGQDSNARLEYQLDGGEWLSLVYSGSNAFNYTSITVTPTTSIGIRFRSLGNGLKQENIRIQIEKAGNALELDRPIDELNGYTLREVFDDGNIFPELTGNVYNSMTNNGRIGVSPNGNIDNIYYGNNYLFNIILNHSYYFYIKANESYPYPRNQLKFSLVDDTIISEKNYSGDTYLISDVLSFNQNYIDVYLHQVSLAQEYKWDDIGSIDLTRLGITNVTKQQMDYWYTQYLTFKSAPTEYSIPVTDIREIELNELVLSNQELIIDSENKIVTLNGANAYQITNKDKSTFLNLPDGDYLIECDLPFELEYKKWVID